MDKNLQIRLFLMSIIGAIQTGTAQEFDWNGYAEWQDGTTYTRTYIVDQKHPDASDDNPGTPAAPLKTIDQAAQRAIAGEQILVRAGHYRETISPRNGGTSSTKMIRYKAAPGEEVIVSGSKRFHGEWIQRKVLTDVLGDENTTYTWSRKVWLATVPDDFFEEGYVPFELPNILPEEHQLMPWAKLVKQLPPYNSNRGMLFQNGKRLTQVVAHGDLTRIPGSFWIDKDERTVHIHGIDSGNPNRTKIEIAIRPQLFRPNEVGLGFIRLEGFTFEHGANGFLRTGTGAVSAMGGHHWIIENNTIRQHNSSGLEFGYLPFEPNDPHPDNIQRNIAEAVGFHIVKNNHIHDCGTAGIRSFVVPDAIIRDNHIHHCGWQDAENYWECSGIKILVAHRTLVSGNRIHDIQGGNGIWLDWDIRYSRATKNVIYNVQNIQGGIFVEASKQPNMVDNNFVWNIDGNGIYANDTDNLMIYHNLVGQTTGPVVHAVVQTERNLNGLPLTAENNTIKNNIFIDGQPMKFSADSNDSNNNLFLASKKPNWFDLRSTKEEGRDMDSAFLRAESDFISGILGFYLGHSEVPKFPRLPEITTDLFNTPRREATTPGPFEHIDNQITLLNEL